MRCERPMPRMSRARLKVIGEVAAGRPFEQHGWRGRSGADFHRRRDPPRRRRRHHPGRHRASTATASRSPKPRSRDGTSAPPASIFVKATCCCARAAASPTATCRWPRHELSGTPGAAPAEGRDARHRRRTGDAGLDPRPRTDRLFQRLRAAGAGPREGAETIDLGIAADTVAATTDGIRRARDIGADILITTGGASVGDHDLVKQSLEAEGVDMAFWRIAMRPGKPMMHGRLGAMRVIGLPGNPVSSYVCAFLFLVPLIRAFPAARPSITRARRPCSAATSPPTTSARTICAPASRSARTAP